MARPGENKCRIETSRTRERERDRDRETESVRENDRERLKVNSETSPRLEPGPCPYIHNNLP